jgi:hypothetical protein
MCTFISTIVVHRYIFIANKYSQNEKERKKEKLLEAGIL